MILATHIMIAAAATQRIAPYNPIFTLFASIATHYLVDRIPHAEYQLNSLKNAENSKLVTQKLRSWKSGWDYARVLCDASIGSLIAYRALRPETIHGWFIFGAIIIGAAIPDFLQFLYLIGNFGFLKPLVAIHDTIHTKTKWREKHPRFGFYYQIAVIAILYFIIA